MSYEQNKNIIAPFHPEGESLSPPPCGPTLMGMTSQIRPIRPVAAFAAAFIAVPLLGACAADLRDEMPGRAGTSPAPTQAYNPVGGSREHWRSWREIQAEETAADETVADERSGPQSPASATATPRHPPQTLPIPPPPRHRGSSSPPPPPVALPAPSALPRAPSNQALIDRSKYDRMNREVEQLRNEDALGRLNPIQQRDLFNKEQSMRRYAPNPLGQ